MSKANGYYVDGNGDPMVDKTGQMIPYVGDIHTNYDASS